MQNSPQSINHLRAVTDVTFHDIDRVIENFVDGHCHGAVDGIAGLLRGIGFLCDEKFQSIECEGDITGKDFQKLKVAVAECCWFRAFDIDGAQYLIMQYQRRCQRTA